MSMKRQLRYGASSTLQLDVPADALIADCTDVPGTVIGDPAMAAMAALSRPMDFPPLCEAVVPGDRVVIAVDPDVPQAGQIVAGVVRALLETSVEASDITILQAERHVPVADLASQLPAEAGGVNFAVHDPADRGQLAYLAASKDASPIVLNRLLCDADLVLPVNLLRPESSLFYAGPHAGLRATFADVQAQRQFRAPKGMVEPARVRRRWDEANEVAWLLGVQLTLQVVAGPGDTVLHVLAGHEDEVSREGRELVNAAWEYQVSERAELVVATIEGELDNQSWENVGRALHAARQVCLHDGTIILCTDLSREFGPALKRLAGCEDRERLLDRLENKRSEDAMVAWLLLEARDASHVFLLSQLAEDAVESLGMGYVDRPEKINRFCRRYGSCILLANAHRASLRTAEL